MFHECYAKKLNQQILKEFDENQKLEISDKFPETLDM